METMEQQQQTKDRSKSEEDKDEDDHPVNVELPSSNEGDRVLLLPSSRSSSLIPTEEVRSDNARRCACCCSLLSKTFGNPVFLSLFSSFLLALYGMLYELIKEDIARSTVTVGRGVLQVFLNLTPSLCLGERFQVLKKEELNPNYSLCLLWFHFTLVVVFGGLRLCLIFAALQMTEMSIVHTILNGNSVLVMILAHCILGNADRLNWVKISAAVLLVVGIFVTSNSIDAIKQAIGNKNYESALGLSLSILALIFSSLGSVYTKKVSPHFSHLHLIASIGGSIVVFGLVSVAFDEVLATVRALKINHQFELTGQSNWNITSFNELPPRTDLSCLSLLTQDGWFQEPLNMTLEQHFQESIAVCEVTGPPYFPTSYETWMMAILVMLIGIGQQYCAIGALKTGLPSRVSVLRSSTILFSFLLQSLSSSVPLWNQWVGAGLILTAIFVNTGQESIKGRVEGLCRKMCCGCCGDERGEDVTVVNGQERGDSL